MVKDGRRAVLALPTSLVGGPEFVRLPSKPSPPHLFCKSMIRWDFRSSYFVRVSSKGLTGAFFVRVSFKGLSKIEH